MAGAATVEPGQRNGYGRPVERVVPFLVQEVMEPIVPAVNRNTASRTTNPTRRSVVLDMPSRSGSMPTCSAIAFARGPP